MRKISLWAKNNKWPARFIIVVIYILFNILGIVSGWLMDDLNVSIPLSVVIFFILLFLAGMITYPVKRTWTKNSAAFYIRQKACDAILAFSTFCMVVYAGNNFEIFFRNYSSLNAAVISTTSLPGDSNEKSYKSIAAFKESMKDVNGKSLTWKEKKKLLKKQIKGIKSSDEMSDGGKAGLIILSIIVALGLLYLLAALSCSISCGGAEGLAVVVAILGTGLIIFLLVRVIRNISRKKDKEKRTKEKPPANG